MKVYEHKYTSGIDEVNELSKQGWELCAANKENEIVRREIDYEKNLKRSYELTLAEEAVPFEVKRTGIYRGQEVTLKGQTKNYYLIEIGEAYLDIVPKTKIKFI